MSYNPYRQQVSHPGLGKYQVITASSEWELNQKVQAKRQQWDAQWERQLAALDAAKAQTIAEERTRAAQSVQNALDSILLDSIGRPELTLEDLKDRKPFSSPKPQAPSVKLLPPEPVYADEKYHPKSSFLTRLSKQKTEAQERENRKAFNRDHGQWADECASITRSNELAASQYQDAVKQWESEKREYERQQKEKNAAIDRFGVGFSKGNPRAVSQFVNLAIKAIKLPIAYENEVESEFDQDSGMLVVDTFLPVLEDIPTLKSVSYVKSKSEFKESYQTATYMKKKYESVVYQLVLRIVKCIFTVGDDSPIRSVVLNGRVSTVDRATGQAIEPVILSLSSTREAFESLNLESIDPKAWFKSSQGVSAASIASVTPVAPIVQMTKEDRRFVEGYSVGGALNEGFNLAAMDWQDFENLIREIFEKEFGAGGGEVKITQASRDGGVDAVVFDPDPIRGGKIVIQAKRYTNTVGVSAVRDLYGTVMNEGAMKGILVTTANYGNDAYEFAKDKPLTLMNGANLLYLLEKHGHKARIDLKEAKELNG